MNTFLTLFFTAGLLAGLITFAMDCVQHLRRHVNEEGIYGFGKREMATILMISFMLLGIATSSLLGLAWLAFGNQLPDAFNYRTLEPQALSLARTGWLLLTLTTLVSAVLKLYSRLLVKGLLATGF